MSPASFIRRSTFVGRIQTSRSCAIFCFSRANVFVRSEIALIEYDCVSTLQLRDWLLRLASDAGVAPAVLEPLAEGAGESASDDEALLQPLLDYATAADGEARTRLLVRTGWFDLDRARRERNRVMGAFSESMGGMCRLRRGDLFAATVLRTLGGLIALVAVVNVAVLAFGATRGAWWTANGIALNTLSNLVLANIAQTLMGLVDTLMVGRLGAAPAADPDPPALRLPGSLAVAALAERRGVAILRVHDVQETREVLTIVRAIKEARGNA